MKGPRVRGEPVISRLKGMPDGAVRSFDGAHPSKQFASGDGYVSFMSKKKRHNLVIQAKKVSM
jgi:hypothetical protein